MKDFDRSWLTSRRSVRTMNQSAHNMSNNPGDHSICSCDVQMVAEWCANATSKHTIKFSQNGAMLWRPDDGGDSYSACGTHFEVNNYSNGVLYAEWTISVEMIYYDSLIRGWLNKNRCGSRETITMFCTYRVLTDWYIYTWKQNGWMNMSK
jgi:hypothetical protein